MAAGKTVSGSKTVMARTMLPSDANPYGNVMTVAEGRTIKLCRCGHSGTKPYCDGTHRRVDFVSRPTFEPEPVTILDDRD